MLSEEGAGNWEENGKKKDSVIGISRDLTGL